MGKLVRLEHAEIRYAQSIKDYVVITTTRANFIVHITMKALEELLPAPSFLRVHRSFMIGIAHIKSIGRTSIKVENVDVPIGGNYKTKVDLLRNRLSD